MALLHTYDLHSTYYVTATITADCIRMLCLSVVNIIVLCSYVLQNLVAGINFVLHL